MKEAKLTLLTDLPNIPRWHICTKVLLTSGSEILKIKHTLAATVATCTKCHWQTSDVALEGLVI